MISNTKRFFLIIGFIFVSVASRAQLVGNFNYGQDGHIYFYLSNSTHFPITVNVAVQNKQTNEQRTDVITIGHNRQFVFGPNANWLWMQGEVFYVTYQNGQTVYWMCPANDPAVQNQYQYNNYGSNNNQSNYNNGFNSPKSNSIQQNGNVSAIAEGYYYYKNPQGRLITVQIHNVGGDKKLDINIDTPNPRIYSPEMGRFFIRNNQLIPDNTSINVSSNPFLNFQSLFSLNNKNLQLSSSMDCIYIDGVKMPKASQYDVDFSNKVHEDVRRIQSMPVKDTRENTSGNTKNSEERYRGIYVKEYRTDYTGTQTKVKCQECGQWDYPHVHIWKK